MPGGPDLLFVVARQVLLDALEAIAPHLDAVVLVGAQAVYLHAGEADLAVAPFTTDGDPALDPTRLKDAPLLEVSLQRAGFVLREGSVGLWQVSVEVAGARRSVGVDLLVPESLGGPGRRAARIPPHARRTARKVAGLEGALVDRDVHTITALAPGDRRRCDLKVAGPAALIVAKVYKILDRKGDEDRSSDKDALDVYRLLRAVPTEALVRRFLHLLEDPLSRQAAARSQAQLVQLFGRPNSPGTQMAVRAAGPLEDPDTLAASLAALAQDLLAELA